MLGYIMVRTSRGIFSLHSVDARNPYLEFGVCRGDSLTVSKTQLPSVKKVTLGEVPLGSSLHHQKSRRLGEGR